MRITSKLLWAAALFDATLVTALGTALYFAVTDPTGVVATTIRGLLP